MSDFYSNLQSTQNNISITENGAVGYKTTGDALVDFNFAVSSFRGNSTTGPVEALNKVIDQKDPYALKYLCYLRDVREGLGERDTFRVCFNALINSPKVVNKDELFTYVLNNIAEYGRYDDLMTLFSYNKEAVVEYIKNQLKEDFKNAKEGKPISLMAKWLPSENTSSPKTREQATTLRKALGATSKEYRQTLSFLRKHLDLVEVKACEKRWDEINYNAVPSGANVKYANAFLRNDETRRREYLSKLAAGDKSVKINSSVNFPHDVLHMYRARMGWGYAELSAYDEAIEQLWKNLKDIPGLHDTMVVRDDSGSMTSSIGNGNITAYEVATALGIYCAEHCTDSYKNKIITFSERPQYLDFSNTAKFGSLHSKYKFLLEHSEVANTNIEAVFNLVLRTAVDNNLSQDELPKQILILSDMEFDQGVRGGWGDMMPLFKSIERSYKSYGYKLPKLIFWNLASRTNTIPCKQNENGVILISGFSQNALNLVLSGKTDPRAALADVLDGDRYKNVPEVQYTKTVDTPKTSKASKTAKKDYVPNTPGFLS